MKTQLKSILVLFGGLITFFSGCKKDDGLGTFIRSTYTSSVVTKDGSIHTGTFEATGGVSGSGTAVMDVHVIDDSSFCTLWLTQNGGSLKIKEACSNDMANPTGSWRIVDGTGIYRWSRGRGRLTMEFPPHVPEGVTVIETFTGTVWLKP
jgi:hypothetical protein